MFRRSALTFVELMIVFGLVVLLLFFMRAILKFHDAAAAMKIMEDTTLPQTPEAARIVDELAKNVRVDVHGTHYHASLHIPIERRGEVTGGMLIAALKKGVYAWAASQDMDVITFVWSKQRGCQLFAEFGVQKK